MAEIIILDQLTADQIAAGEVVERPASVVKELCENSLDAGASIININIKNGGISLIELIDNGHGMLPDDMETAFSRHATSKLTTIEDFASILTMGFRGEALPSIASVSKLRISSRRIGEDRGQELYLEAGLVKSSQAISMNEGTRVTVENLFYNTPARYKFLKKDVTEASYITEIVGKFVLSRPDVSFRLINNDKEIIHSPGNNDLKSAIYSIYGSKITSELIAVEYDFSGINISGYVGKPSIGPKSRRYQNFFVNGRYVKSSLLQASLEEAFKTLIMKGHFPFCVLDIQINPALVDVNIHPQKTQVKFENDREIFSALNRAVKFSLERDLGLPGSGVGPSDSGAGLSDPGVGTGFTPDDSSGKGAKESTDKSAAKYEEKSSDTSSDTSSDKFADMPSTGPELPSSLAAAYNNLSLFDTLAAGKDKYNYKKGGPGPSSTTKAPHSSSVDKGSYDYDGVSDTSSSSSHEGGKGGYGGVSGMVSSQERGSGQDFAGKGNEAFTAKLGTDIFDGREAEEVQYDELLSLKELLYSGSIFNTFLIFEAKDYIILMDQHAAHERILFEEFLERFMKKEVRKQPLLEGQIIELTVSEVQEISTKLDLLDNLGFEAEVFGPSSLILRTCPSDLEEMDYTRAFSHLIEEILAGDYGQNHKVVDLIYTMSCKAAVKAHDRLSDLEVAELVDRLIATQRNTHCPHGRPITVRISRRDIEKWFKRIVS